MKFIFAAFISVFLLALPVGAVESIVEFRSDITVNIDASLDVHETIAVLAEGIDIRHGIFRDFPTSYQDANGVQTYVELDVKIVTRSGQPENYMVESISGGKRIRIGSADTFVGPGIHKYEIRYHTTRQLGFFKDYDELYWNVTGNGWRFPIDAASVTVHLPSGAVIKQFSTYSGPSGSASTNAIVNASKDGIFDAEMSKPLAPNEGFTIAVAWQKGIVTPPSASQQQIWMLRDNAGFLGLGATFLAVAGYFLYAWARVGRDPPKGTIVPLFYPPENWSPADVRYVWKQGFDNRTMAAAFVGLGVRGLLKITNDGGEADALRLLHGGFDLLENERDLRDVELAPQPDN